MAFLPISPLSPELTLIKPIDQTGARLGPIPNVADGIPGLAGIGRVEMPGVGVFGPGGLDMPQLPDLSAPAAASSPAALPSVTPAPEVTPFPGSSVQPTSTPAPRINAAPAPTPAATVAPQTSSTPVPNAGELQSPAVGSPYSTQPITTDRLQPLLQTPAAPTAVQATVPVKTTSVADTFGKYLKDAAASYNGVQTQADSMIQHLAVGDKVDIHDVALAVQKASITNQLAIQVRNRLVEAYQEMMRMPV